MLRNRVWQQAFERLERPEGKLSWAVLRGLEVSNDLRLPDLLWDDAMRLIIEVGRQQLQQGFIQLPAYWLAALPDAVRAKQPWLQLFQPVIWCKKATWRKRSLCGSITPDC